MKNPFARLLHHYTYNLKLKNKLVISHAILLMVPTAVVTGFLYARMYGIVMDDTIRSEQALAAQTVGTIESLYWSYPVSWVLTLAIHIVFLLIYKRQLEAPQKGENACAPSV